MPLVHAPLPFEANALEPYMSARTLKFHHGKHHRAYIDNTNALTKGTPLENASLEIVIKASNGNDQKLFNNSAQVWNHDFFWQSLTPTLEPPAGALATMLIRDFGGLDEFNAAFKMAATSHFGSGWAWLVVQNDKLEIISYHDADTPLVYPGVTPLLTADVWEHAYYLDYQNSRPAFIDVYLKHLVNWRGAEARLEGAGG